MSDAQKAKMGKIAVSFAEASAQTALEKLRISERVAPKKVAAKIAVSTDKQTDLFRSMTDGKARAAQ